TRVAWSGSADGEVAVGGADRLIGRRGLVGGTQRPWDLTGSEVAPRLPHLQRYSSLEYRALDELPVTGLLADTQRGERANGAVPHGEHVADSHAALARIASWLR